MKIMKCSEAKAQGLPQYYTGKPCRNGHSAPRYASSSECLECVRLKNNAPGRSAQIAKLQADYRQMMKGTVKGKQWSLLGAAKRRAISRGIPFDLDKEWLLERLTHGRCEATSIPFTYGKHGDYRANPFSPSIDQIIPGKGYTKDNCRLVVTIYNYAKSDFSDAEVRRMAYGLMST